MAKVKLNKHLAFVLVVSFLLVIITLMAIQKSKSLTVRTLVNKKPVKKDRSSRFESDYSSREDSDDKSRDKPDRKREHKRRDSSESESRKDCHSDSADSGSWKPVKVVCEPLKIEPVFTCHGVDVDVRLEIAGGIHPYSVTWSTGRTGLEYFHAAFNQELTATVQDSRHCKTEIKVLTPSHSQAARCSNVP